MSLNDWFLYNAGQHHVQQKPAANPDVIDYSPVDAREGILVEGDGVQPAEAEDEIILADLDKSEMGPS